MPARGGPEGLKVRPHLFRVGDGFVADELLSVGSERLVSEEVKEGQATGKVQA